MSKELEALDRIKCISLTHFGYDEDENMDGEWEYEPVEVDDGTIEENYPEEIKIIEHALKALEIIKEKGLSLNELWYIKQNEPWSVYIEKMREIYFDDPCVEDGKLKTQEEYELLKKVLLCQ